MRNNTITFIDEIIKLNQRTYSPRKTLLLAVIFFITSPKFLRSLRFGGGISF